MTERELAVLDRVVDGETAVLLVEEAGEVVDEFTVPVDDLPDPEAERLEGSVFEVVFEDGELDEATLRPDETASRRRAAQERFDRLSERLGDG